MAKSYWHTYINNNNNNMSDFNERIYQDLK